ncbi:MAG: histidine kinase [Gemmatimonadetes bacterium]|nr:histidine kinase [Gemmatimonadota bacterium]
MRVGQRLFLAVLPAVLGVFTVAGLAYWGQYAHTAPTWVVGVAVVAAVVSLIVAWTNTRYVAKRIERLMGDTLGSRPRRKRQDELDAIEDVVDRLSGAVGEAEAARQLETDRLAARNREYAELLSSASDEAVRRLDEVRLPLHILLENKFGDLNENQEEMLGAARQAAEAASAELERLREIAGLDRGTVVLRRDAVRPGEMIGLLMPALAAAGEPRQVKVTADIAPALPAVFGDRARLQEALSLLLHDAVRRTPDGAEVHIHVDGDTRAIHVAVHHGPGVAETPDVALAVRLIAAQGGTLARAEGETRLDFSRA